MGAQQRFAQRNGSAQTFALPSRQTRGTVHLSVYASVVPGDMIATAVVGSGGRVIATASVRVGCTWRLGIDPAHRRHE